MFQTQKTVGNFVVSTTFDSPHHHVRRFRNGRKPVFSDELISKQKRAAFYSITNLPIGEVYKRALGRCPSISVNAKRQNGLPCIAGTRIPVHLVIWAVEQTGSIEGALKSYPDLTAQQVKDALYFAETILGSPNVNAEAALTA